MPWLRSLVVLLLVSMPVLAEDWPQWLGPRRDGTSMEKIKPWKGDLKVVWRQPVGPGHSSPVIVGGKVFLHTRVADPAKEAEEVTAFDANTGKESWRTSYPRNRFFSPFGTGPQATPAVVDGKLFSFGATGLLTCFDIEKGKLTWQVDTFKTLGASNLFFGTACSPLVEGDKVVINVGGKGASVVAFKTDSGEVVWKKLDDRASYSSGIAFGEKERQLLFLTQQGLRAFAPKDGDVLWEFPFVDKLNESSTTPVKAGDLILASSVTIGMVALELEKKDGKITPKEAWRNKQLNCYFSTPVPIGKEHVYLVTGAISFRPTSTLRCVELKTGKILWSEENVGKYHAAMVRTADEKLLMLSDLGNLILLDPSPKGYNELARSQVVKKEQIWAHPALSNGKVYFRDEKELICLELPK